MSVSDWGAGMKAAFCRARLGQSTPANQGCILTSPAPRWPSRWRGSSVSRRPTRSLHSADISSPPPSLPSSLPLPLPRTAAAAPASGGHAMLRSRMFWKMSSGVAAEKGGRPVTISKRMVPRLHQSTSSPCPVPSSSSGAR